MERLGFPKQPAAIRYGVATLINSLGTGMFYPFAILFFQHKFNRPIVEIGFGLSVAAALALLGIAPVGRAMDGVGAKKVLIVALVIRCLAFVGFLVVGNFPLLAFCAMIDLFCMRVGQLADQAMVGELAPVRERPRWYALSRAAFNAGMGGGALLGGLLISVSEENYNWLVAVDASTFLLAALIYVRLPISGAQIAVKTAKTVAVWRDGLFIALGAVNAMLWLCAMAIEIALPVYLKQYLDAPLWTVSLIFAINTFMVTLLTMALTKWTRKFPAMRVIACGGMCYVVAFLGLLAFRPATLPVLLLVLIASIVVFTIGEVLITVTAIVALSALAPPGRLGSYLASSQIMLGVAGCVAPLLFTYLLGAGRVVLWGTLATTTLVLVGITRGLQRGVESRTRVSVLNSDAETECMNSASPSGVHTRSSVTSGSAGE
jgi:MFS family permease